MKRRRNQLQLDPNNYRTWPVEAQIALRDQLLLKVQEQERNNRLRYMHDPVGFARDCIDWGNGTGLTPYQQEILAALVTQRRGNTCRAAVRGPHTLGKAQPHSLVIDTPSGPKRFGDLRVGDFVFGGSGLPTKILGVYERGEMEVVRVWFNDKSYTYCSEDHLWTVRKFDWKPRTGREPEWITLPLSEIVARGLSRRNGKATARKWDIPTIRPLEFPFQWVPVDPYTLGVWPGYW